MNPDSILSISRQGLDVERARLEAAAHAIEIADTPIPPGRAIAGANQADFGGKLSAATPEREVHDPTNPMADANGMVHYPAVDMVAQMSTLISATRAYEANVRAFNALRSMELSALDIGGTQG